MLVHGWGREPPSWTARRVFATGSSPPTLLRHHRPASARRAVAQPARVSNAKAPDSAVGGEGDAVAGSSRHSDDALTRKGLELLWLPLRSSLAAPSSLVASARRQGSAACTSILYRVCMTPPNEHTSEGGRDDRRGPVPCGVDPIKCSSAQGTPKQEFKACAASSRS